MYTYTAYHVGIASEIPLPELIAAECSPDVHIHIVDLSRLTLPSDGGNAFRGSVEGLAHFEVLHGREILVAPLAGVDEDVIRPLILGPLLAIALRQRGLFVLHASSFVVNGRAVAFMGESGWGKSTLVQAFHNQGYPVLTDDVMAISMQGEQPLVLSGFPQIKLWSDSATSLGHQPDTLPRLHSQTTKHAHQLKDGFAHTACPLTHLYVLSYGDRHEITRLAPSESFVELVRHSRAVTLLNATDYQVQHLQQSTRLIQMVSISRLSRKHSLSALNELVELIKRDFQQEPMLRIAN